MTTPVVLDASAGAEMLLATEVGDSLDRLLPHDAVEWVPEVYFAEVAAVVRRSELAGRITSERAATALDRLLSAPIDACRSGHCCRRLGPFVRTSQSPMRSTSSSPAIFTPHSLLRT